MGALQDTIDLFPDSVKEDYEKEGMVNPKLVTDEHGNRYYVSGGGGGMTDTLRAAEEALPPVTGNQPPPAKPGPQVSAPAAVGLGFADTASMGFAPDIYGGVVGASQPSRVKGDNTIDPALNAVDAGSVKAAREGARNLFEAAGAQHPGYYLGGQLGGSLASALVPFVPEAEGASLAGRAVRAGADQAISGGLYGFGSGDSMQDRLTRMGVGAGTGAFLGPAGSMTADAARFGAGGVSKWAGGVFDALRAGRPGLIDEMAATRIINAQKASMASGGTGWTPEMVAAAKQAGIPVKIGDVGGAPIQSVADTAAVQSPQAREILKGLIDPRYAAQQQRAAGFIGRLTGNANAVVDTETLQQAARVANKDNYTRLYNTNGGPIKSDELDRLMGDPALVQAMKETVKNGKTRAIADGYGAFNPGVTVTDDGRVVFNRGPNGVPAYPNMQFWDYTYRNLRDAALQANPKTSIGQALFANASKLRDELDRIVPDYKKTRQGAGAFLDAEDALDAGRKFVWAPGENAEYAADIAKMSAPDKQLFMRGFGHEMVGRLSELGNSPDVLKQAFLTSPAAKQRIEMALGPNGATQMEAYMRAEGAVDRLRGILGNSKTAQRFWDLAGVGSVGVGAAAADAYHKGDFDLKDALGTAITLGGAYGTHLSRGLQVSVAKRVAEMLVSNDPAVLQAGVKAVAGNRQLMDALRSVGDILDRVVTSRGIVRGAVQAPVQNIMDSIGPEQR